MKISKYTNQNTPLSIVIISPIIEKANQLTIKDIEEIQVKHGISDQLLGDVMGVNKSQVSRMKKGDSHLALQGKIALYFMFEKLKKE